MNKKSFVAVVSVLMLTACGNQPTPQFSVSPSEATIAVGETVQLTSSQSTLTQWESSNDFLASVDTAGLVTAKHVGVAEVGVLLPGDDNANGLNEFTVSHAYSTITIAGKYNTYVEPLLDFALTQDQLIAKLGKPTETLSMGLETILIYGDTKTDDYVTTYTFFGTQYDFATVYILRNIKAKDIQNFLLERYQRLDQETYINSYTMKDATLEIYYEVESETWDGHEAIGIFYTQWENDF